MYTVNIACFCDQCCSFVVNSDNDYSGYPHTEKVIQEGDKFHDLGRNNAAKEARVVVGWDSSIVCNLTN
jgi:hypothetical protein